jgi:hypothetical protein
LSELRNLQANDRAQCTHDAQREQYRQDHRWGPPHAPLAKAPDQWREDEGQQRGDHERLKDLAAHDQKHNNERCNYERVRKRCQMPRVSGSHDEPCHRTSWAASPLRP